MELNETDLLVHENYQPLSPFKCLQHEDRLEQFLDDPYLVTPVTAHLVPTLYCNQRCYFCTYGQYKEKGRNIGLQMSLAEVKRCIDQLAVVGVRGVIFTGGGEPSLFPYLVEAMTYARSFGMDVALNTNGYRCSDGLMEGILSCKPTYIRISFNSGHPYTQKLVTGRNNFHQVLQNIERFAKRKSQLAPETDLSVGYVVNIVNLHEMMDFLGTMVMMERRVVRATGVEGPIYSLQFRPVSNFEHSKHTTDSKRIDALLDFIHNRYGKSDRDELAKFIHNGDQPSPKTMERALSIIENELIPALQRDTRSKIKIVYPRRKFSDLITGLEKPYERCLSCPWYLFIWPDGSVYHCVEWAGSPEFAIGNMFTTPLSEILSGEKRLSVLAKINGSVIKDRCVKICAHHEMNILLNGLLSGEMVAPELVDRLKNKQIVIRHENFL